MNGEQATGAGDGAVVWRLFDLGGRDSSVASRWSPATASWLERAAVGKTNGQNRIQPTWEAIVRIGGSLVLIAVGAILRFAITVRHTHGFSVHTAGVILMVVGAIGFVASIIWMATQRRSTVIHQNSMGTSRTTYNNPPPPPL